MGSTAEELEACREHLRREWALLPRLRAVLCLGRVAMQSLTVVLREMGHLPPGGSLRFGHGVAHELAEGRRLFASYHPSQQNTFTGRLTAASFDAVLRKVWRHVDGARPPRKARP